MATNVLLSGVGGQGIITASKVISEACLSAGFQVKKSEVHGMSQRGGSVESHVRFSPDSPVYSPLIPGGEVDVLLAFELLEGLRAVAGTRPDALVLIENRTIVPGSVTSGPFEYPEDILDRLYASGRKVRVIDAFDIAAELGETRAANIVMLGAASASLAIPVSAWEEAISRAVKAKAVETNVRAFHAGVASG